MAGIDMLLNKIIIIIIKYLIFNEIVISYI